MTERNPKSNSPKAILADLAFEESASFSFNMGDFDRIWQEYLEH